MKNWIDRFNLKNLNVMVFVSCILLSFVFWLLTQISSVQKTYATFKIEYINQPEDFVITNDLPEEINLELEAQGFQLLKYEWFSGNNFISIDLSKFKTNNGDSLKTGVWLTNAAVPEMEGQLKNQVEITGTRPDTIFLEMAKMTSEYLKIKPEINIDVPKGYRIVRTEVQPDSVNVKGPYYFFSHQKELKVSIDSIRNFTDTITLNYKLPTQVGVSYSPSSVDVSLYKENIVKHQMQIPIDLVNVPQNKKIRLFPSNVNVSFYCTSSEREGIKSSDFKLKVDYEEIDKVFNSSRLTVHVEKVPHGVERLKVSPGKVEFLLQNL